MSKSILFADGIHEVSCLILPSSNRTPPDISRWYFPVDFRSSVSSISTEIKATHKQNDNKGFSTRIGVGIIGKVKLSDNLSAYTRVGAGNKKTNTKTFNFWAITPGLKYKIDDKWSIKGGVRFRDAFDTDKYRDYTKTYKAGVGYKLSKETSLSIGFKRKVGDSEYNAIGLGYGISF